LQRSWILLGLALVEASCAAHNVTVVNRQTGEIATTSVPGGRPSGDIQITTGGRVYTGTWVYVANGGAIGLSSVSAFSGAATATATGTMMAIPTGGGGTVIASSPDGSTLRCQFQFNQMGNTGLGVCQDSRGGVYDLQIHP
jgi:hypothetical protein